MSTKNIICIGDSHVSFFSGYNKVLPIYPCRGKNKNIFFEPYRIGSVLAYNLIQLNTTELGREKIFELLENIPKKSVLLFCFGEIDIRCHLIRQSNKQERPLSGVVQDCIDRYLIFINEVRLLDFKVIVFGAIPTSYNYDPEYPFFGTMQQRNECTLIFNNLLRQNCEDLKINYISINKYLVNKNGLTKSEYFFDSLHLSTLSLAFVKKELYTLPNFTKKNRLIKIVLEMIIMQNILISKLKKFNRIIRFYILGKIEYTRK